MRPYAEILHRFTSGMISAPEFEAEYLKFAKKDERIHGQPAFGIIDRMFADVDEYFDDPDETPEERARAADILRRQAQDALNKLRKL